MKCCKICLGILYKMLRFVLSGRGSLIGLISRKTLRNATICCFLGKEGLVGLASVIGGKSPLRTLYAKIQKDLDESETIEIFTKL
jgi:hypothetical protein